MFLYYNPTAERLDDLPVSIRRSAMTRGMNIARVTFHTSSSVEGLPYAKTTSDSSTCENNPWVFGWMNNHHVRHWPNARTFAQSTWTKAPRVFVTPMGHQYESLLR
eukprot:5708835-Pyramimonas_sp.AAC.1